uniref:UDENN domain-containing protein n=1 Tax=Eptatretus burgeri TaxID=7764 RepID=A0A8C4R498_EPTBU
MVKPLPRGLLDAVLVVGALEEEVQAAALLSDHLPKVLKPVVLDVLVPPFTINEVTSQKSNGTSRQMARRRSFRKPKAEKVFGTTSDAKELTESQDVSVPRELNLAGIPLLCFPEGLCLQVQRPEDSFHSLVFTDVDGNRTYGVVLTFWRPVQANIVQNGSVRRLTRSCDMQFSFPIGICITSKQPYYTALTDCLSRLSQEV